MVRTGLTLTGCNYHCHRWLFALDRQVRTDNDWHENDDFNRMRTVMQGDSDSYNAPSDSLLPFVLAQRRGTPLRMFYFSR